ncbi:hypothetical protein ACFXGI_38705, partial [Streptomyces sp. NPDC059355]|uniref:hypothetical protein n=1 Tax=Streptomyces sp. NPDC059355 TaxID=3346811 RepID=UPI0036BB75F1
MRELDVDDRPDRHPVRLDEVEAGLRTASAQPGVDLGLHVQVVGARNAAGSATAQVRVPVGTWVVREVADPVGIQLGGQLQTTPSKQQAAPECVVLVLPAEGVQLDRFQWEHQRLFGVRAAQNRRLYLPSVTPHEPPPFVLTQRATTPAGSAADHALVASDAAATSNSLSA